MEHLPVEFRRDAMYIEGRARVLLCSSLFYFRIPREDWQERMRQLRMAGYHCIDVYIPWNFHELAPDSWCFEGMHDVAAFLELAAHNQLYVVARPGPYICSEWDGGALPSWLYGEDMPLRQNDPRYLNCLKRWLDKVLPIVAAHEVGRGGSVIAVQLENEMDFFACAEPKEYVSWLCQEARANGVRVPLTVCAGQGDVQGAGGMAQGVYPTFNVYADEHFPYLECQIGHLRTLAAERGAPVLVTETNREHAFLKRELASGARLISPYNQVGGSNIDMTNGISNWAADARRPLALMATDYDFHSMITVDGRMREEVVQARLLAGLINSLGEELALAQPQDAPIRPQCSFPTAMELLPDGDERPCFPALRLKTGWLVGATNLSDQPGVMRLDAEDGPIQVAFHPYETRLLPWQLSLASWGSNAVLCWAEAELCGMEANAEGLHLTFCGDEAARVRVGIDTRRYTIQGESWQAAGDGLWLRVLPPVKAMNVCTGLEPVSCEIPSAIETVPVGNVIRHSFRLREHAVPVADGIHTMEKACLYRGDVFYETYLPDGAPVLAGDAADLLWTHTPHGALGVFGDGGPVLLPGGPGAWCLRAQSWGHCNFDDVRQPSLKMGSDKGVSSLTRVVQRQDITSLWSIYPHAKYAVQGASELRKTDSILATTINTWSYPASPMTADFVRKVFPHKDCNRFWLFVEHSDEARITVYVDGVQAGSLRMNSSWLDLSPYVQPGRSAELCLQVTRPISHASLGKVEWIGGLAVTDVKMYGLDVEAWRALYPETPGESATLPLTLDAGQECMLTNILPNTRSQARTLLLDGYGVEATLIGGGHVCGRIQLSTEGYPDVRGGSSRRIYLPAAWAEQGLCLHLCALGNGGQLKSLQWESIRGDSSGKEEKSEHTSFDS